MASGVYLTKAIFDIFDIMEKLGIKKVTRIINDIKEVYSNPHRYTEITTLGKENMDLERLKGILDKKHSDKELEDFIKVFKNYVTGKDMSITKSQIEKESLPLRFSEDFWVMLDSIDDKVCWEFINLEQNSDVKNKLGIDMMDVSDEDYHFDVYYPNGKRATIKISEFVSIYLKNKFGKGEVYEFIKAYNKGKNKTRIKPDDSIEVPEFKFNPKDVRATFISLVTETYPHGFEDGVIKYLPQLDVDQYGNLFKVIGKSDTMFTSHLDTASRDKSDITLVSKLKNGQELIMSDGTTILGADDKAGVTVMLYMMAHNVPGVYYFFLGEERGGIGSGKVADNYSKFDILKGIKKVVSFDRRNYYSVITSQMGVECCSDEFAQSLCDELNKSGLKLNLDPTGVFTDSANFIDEVPECTNISVGYFNEHTHDEVQNINYLEILCKACVAADWDKLVIRRKVGFDEELMAEWSGLVSDIKESAFYNDISIKGIDGKIIIQIEFDDTALGNAYDDLSVIETILLIHKCNPNLKFDGNIIKIQIG